MTTEQTRRPFLSYRVKKQLRAFFGAFFIVGSTFLLLEAAVRFTDPWGLSFFNDLLVLGNELFIEDDTRGYIIKDGQHKFSYWNLTVEDGIRRTPETNTSADCTFVMMGDSVTMGHGINDDDVWVNDLARAFPDIHFINAGVSIYNSTNVYETTQAFPDADAYIYLIIANDIQPEVTLTAEGAFPGERPTNLPYLVRYVNFMMNWRTPEGLEPNILPLDHPLMQRFITDLDMLVENEKVRLISFDSFELTTTLQELGYDVYSVRFPPHIISFVDNHLNAEGNQELADSVTDYIADVQATQCTDEV